MAMVSTIDQGELNLERNLSKEPMPYHDCLEERCAMFVKVRGRPNCGLTDARSLGVGVSI